MCKVFWVRRKRGRQPYYAQGKTRLKVSEFLVKLILIHKFPAHTVDRWNPAPFCKVYINENQNIFIYDENQNSNRSQRELILLEKSLGMFLPGTHSPCCSSSQWTPPSAFLLHLFFPTNAAYSAPAKRRGDLKVLISSNSHPSNQ